MANLQEIYEEYGKPVYRFLLSLTGDETEAEELLQETFYQAFLHIDRFEGRCSLYTWLCQIGKNAWLKECRRKKRFYEKEPEPEFARMMAPQGEQPEAQFLKKEERRKIWQAVSRLEEPYREVFVLHAYGEVKLKEIACDIVQDLLPLYEEELCSPGSRMAVEEHLEECTECRKLVEKVVKVSEMTVPIDIEIQEEEASKAASRHAVAIAGSLRKIRRRWFQSLLWIIILLPICFALGTMIFNQIHRQGLCFTNLDEILTTYRFAVAMEQGDYEKAVEFMNYEELYYEIQDLVTRFPAKETLLIKGEEYEQLKKEYEMAAAMSLEEFTEIVKASCLEDMRECLKQGITFENNGYKFSYLISENEHWIIEYGFLVNKDGLKHKIVVGFSVENGKLSLGSSAGGTDEEWFDTVHEAFDLYYMH